MQRSAGPVLVVDDDEDVRDSIALVLRDEGYEVKTASNGKEALDVIERTPPAVVLLDLMMPVMSGWSMLDALRRRETPPPPVVVVSAAVPPAPAGASDYLRKPIDIDALLEKVQSAVSN